MLFIPAEKEGGRERVFSNGILASCQPHRTISGRKTKREAGKKARRKKKKEKKTNSKTALLNSCLGHTASMTDPPAINMSF